MWCVLLKLAHETKYICLLTVCYHLEMRTLNIEILFLNFKQWSQTIKPGISEKIVNVCRGSSSIGDF